MKITRDLDLDHQTAFYMVQVCMCGWEGYEVEGRYREGWGGGVFTSICISLSCGVDSSPLQLMRAESCLQCLAVEGLPFSCSFFSRRALALRLDQSSL